MPWKYSTGRSVTMVLIATANAALSVALATVPRPSDSGYSCYSQSLATT